MPVKIETTKLNACPVCNSADVAVMFDVSAPAYITEVDKVTFPLAKCNSCAFVFLSERPIPEHLLHYYPSTCPNFKSSTGTAIEKLVFLLLDKLKPAQTTQKLKVLDVGFGAGDFLNACYEKSHESYGVDFSPHAFAEAKRKNPNLNIFCGTVFDAGYKENFFDWINLSHVLEHEYDPLHILTYIYKLLKKGGKVTIDVPNYGGLYYAVAKEKADYFVPQHVNFFTPATLALLLEEAGFNNNKVVSKFGNNVSYHILKTIGIQKSFYNKSLLNQLLGLVIVPIELMFNKGDVISATAEK